MHAARTTPRTVTTPHPSNAASDEEILEISDPKNPRKRFYVIERILDHRYDQKHHYTYYLVKWAGYPDSENTWESKHSFPDQRPIEEYRARIAEEKAAQKALLGEPSKPKPKPKKRKSDQHTNSIVAQSSSKKSKRGQSSSAPPNIDQEASSSNSAPQTCPPIDSIEAIPDAFNSLLNESAEPFTQVSSSSPVSRPQPQSLHSTPFGTSRQSINLPTADHMPTPSAAPIPSITPIRSAPEETVSVPNFPQHFVSGSSSSSSSIPNHPNNTITPTNIQTNSSSPKIATAKDSNQPPALIPTPTTTTPTLSPNIPNHFLELHTWDPYIRYISAITDPTTDKEIRNIDNSLPDRLMVQITWHDGTLPHGETTSLVSMRVARMRCKDAVE
ncbi:hypothetical protein HDU79_010682 [Rhizoclosmatium sp. JEL0117]|nr:hypothetical protein HDU79_010682 [Rhizoclosmatium sp. JEL0117]